MLLYDCTVLQRRIDDLESFYLSHVDDEKSVLFEKQRLKLRKLLHEYDSVMQPSATNFGGVHTPAPGKSGLWRGEASMKRKHISKHAFLQDRIARRTDLQQAQAERMALMPA